MVTPTRPFERYRTRSALFLMIYAVTALIFGIPNIMMLTYEDDRRFLIILATSILVVSRFIGYIYLAGFALLDPARIKESSGRLEFSIGLIITILLANAGFFLYRFGLTDISVTAVNAGCLVTAGVLITHLAASRKRGLSRSTLMKIVSGVLIALGSADICITRFYALSPLIGLVTLFFGISTERKSLALAFKQTLAAAGSAAGCGIAVYYMRWLLQPGMVEQSMIKPVAAIAAGLVLGITGFGYYWYARRLYTVEPGRLGSGKAIQ